MRIGSFYTAFAIGICTTAALHSQDEADLLEVSLSELLDMKVSTAARYEQSVREAPSSVTIVTAEEIRQHGYRDLADVFNGTRGFYVSDDRNYSYLGVRGFSRPTDFNNRVLLLMNGLALNEPLWGSMPLGRELGISLDGVERVEIVRGPGSALYGASAMFAVVNVITKTGNTIDGVEGSVEVGSFGTKRGRAMYGQEFASGLDVAIAGQWEDRDGGDLYFAEYDDPSTNNGVAEGLDWDRSYGFTAHVRYGRWSIQGMVNSRETGVPTGSYESDFNDSRARTLDETRTVEVKYERRIGAGGKVVARSAYRHSGYEGFWPYDIINPEVSVANSAMGDVQYRRDLSPSNRLIVGAEYEDNYKSDYRVWDEEAVYFDEDHPYSVASVYVQDEHQLRSNLALTVGLRGDRYSTVGNTTTPRGALVYHPRGSTTLKLLYGEAFRAPGMYEIYYDDSQGGGQAKANPDLKPEKIRTAELVWEQQLRKGLSTTASLYRYTMRGLIDQVIDLTDELIQHQNVEKVEATGLEMELSGQFARGISAHTSYVFQRARDAKQKRRLSNQPSHVLKGGLNMPVGGHSFLSPEVRYESSRKTLYDVETEAYLLVDLRLFVALERPSFGPLSGLSDHVGLSLTARNLLDTDYATPGGWEHLQPSIGQDGRSFRLSFDFAL